jgi:hypothetical protein
VRSGPLRMRRNPWVVAATLKPPHTENRVGRMSGASAGKNPIPGDPYAGHIPVDKGETVRLVGRLPPCSRCRGAMNRIVRELGVNVVCAWASPSVLEHGSPPVVAEGDERWNLSRNRSGSTSTKKMRW